MRASLRLAPLVSRLRSRLGSNVDYRMHASRSWILHPTEASVIPPALFDPGDLQKISSFGPGEGRDVEMRRIRGGPGSHTAMVAYELDEVLLSGGQLFTAKVHHVIAGRRAPILPKRAIREFDRAVMASTSLGWQFFGHWMTEDLPLLLAAREIADPVSVSRPLTPAQAGYVGLLGLATEASEDAYFKKLVLIDDVGQNSHKRARFAQLRAMAAQHVPPTTAAGVMLLRGTGGSMRVLMNEQEVMTLARARGFNVLDPARTEAIDILRACLGAKVVLGVEGSQLTNGMLWMSPGGTMVVIQPPDRFQMILKNWADCIGIRSAFVVGDAEPKGGFRADIAALDKMLDAVLR